MGATICRKNGATDQDLIDFGIITKSGNPYKATHQNHPCTIWMGECYENWDWALALGLALCDEYRYRFSKKGEPPKRHACEDVLIAIHKYSFKHIPHLSPYPESSIEAGLGPWEHDTGPAMGTPFVQAMPDEYKHKDAVKAYRAYYHSKAWFAKWEKGRNAPSWWKGVGQ